VGVLLFLTPLIGGFASVVVGGLAALGTGLGIAFQRSGLGRARRRARRAVRPVVREAERFDRALEPWRRPLERAAKDWAAASARDELERTDVETLREAGASRVRWGALREAGYRSLADVAGVSPRRLARVHGVGPEGARRVAKAARVALERRSREGPPPPRGELDTPGAEPLARRLLDFLDAREAAGPDAQRLRRQGAELARERREVERGTDLGSWILSPLRRARATAAREASERLAERAEALAADGSLEEARRGREALRAFRPERRDGNATRREFGARYAACCAALEEVLAQLGLRPPRGERAGRGGLSSEVAARVEAFELRDGALRATLRPYQAFGAKYLLVQQRTILGDEMGLGKTMQALAAMVHLAEDEERARFFVVAPAGLLVNWEREVRRFTGLEPFLVYGDELEERLASWLRVGGVAITSYATLRGADLGAVLESRQEGLALCAVDEAHYVKNPEAGRTQAVRRLLARSDHAVLMSGTPMENHPREFLDLIEAIRPADAAELRGQELALDAALGSVRAFHRAVSKVYLRRNQEDVLTELPERLEVEEWVENGPEDHAAYRAEVAARNFMGMRRAATLGSVGTPSAKLERLEELLVDHRESGRKVLVFSYFLDVLAAVAERFESVGTISGAVQPRDRQALCDDFGAREGHALLLLQIDAGGQGLNLQAASAVVLLEPQTKPSTEAQAVARAHRMGQTQRVLVHRLLARGTCDEALVELLAEKAELFDAYARKSLVKEASPAATETEVAKQVMRVEARRLGLEPAPEPSAGS